MVLNYTENDNEVYRYIQLMTIGLFTCLNIVIGSVGNALVFLTVYSIPSLHTVSNVLLASLACSDFLLAVFGLPLAAYANVRSGVNIRDTSIKADILYIPVYVSFPVSAWHLLFISLDRYFAISYPYKYQARATIQRTFYLIIFSWVIGITWGLVPLFGGLEIDEDCLSDICRTLNNSSLRVHEIMSSAFVITVFIAIVLIYARVFSIVKRLSFNVRDIPRSNSIPIPRNTIEQASLRNTYIKVTAMVVGGFFISWLPMVVYMILNTEYKPHNVSLNILKTLAECTSLCSISLNPLIYNFMLKSFRDGFRKTIRKVMGSCTN
ncbi:trace amine-associated receptor 7f-like [Anneissia japonica]|uniref:trace amine-associated receptor 7f-like n=1 Tax=Anneissia japonica TaxID=1529436 RepID=UPI0014255DFF|nr:trace amine-associated receptor 7f-like [Anneissia japonica]